MFVYLHAGHAQQSRWPVCTRFYTPQHSHHNNNTHNNNTTRTTTTTTRCWEIGLLGVPWVFGIIDACIPLLLPDIGYTDAGMCIIPPSLSSLFPSLSPLYVCNIRWMVLDQWSERAYRDLVFMGLGYLFHHLRVLCHHDLHSLVSWPHASRSVLSPPLPLPLSPSLSHILSLSVI